MSESINSNQCEVIINEGVNNLMNMGRILNEIKSSNLYQYEYNHMEKLFLEKWGIQSSELDSIIGIYKKLNNKIKLT